MHYDLNTFSLWFGAGLLLIVGGLNQSGWKHRGIVIGMIGVGVVFILGAVLWPFLSPSLATFMSRAATPTTWVVMLLLVTAYLLLGPHFKIVPNGSDGTAGHEDNDSVDLSDMPETERRVAEWIEVAKNNAKADFSAAQTWIQQLHEANQDLLKRVAEIERRTTFLPNLGNTLGEAMESFQGALNSQIMRIEDTVDKFRAPLEQLRSEIRPTLHFVVQQADAVLLRSIIEMAPKDIETDKLSDHSDQRIKMFLTTLREMLRNDPERLRELENCHRNAEHGIDEQLRAGRRPKTDLDPYVYRERAIRLLELQYVLDDVRKKLSVRNQTMVNCRQNLNALYDKTQPT